MNEDEKRAVGGAPGALRTAWVEAVALSEHLMVLFQTISKMLRTGRYSRPYVAQLG